MAGAMGCGELLHSMEDRIDQAVRMKSVQTATLDGLETSYDRAAMLIDRLRNPGAASAEPEPPKPEVQVASVSVETAAEAHAARDRNRSRQSLRNHRGATGRRRTPRLFPPPRCSCACAPTWSTSWLTRRAKSRSPAVASKANCWR
jgi:hypothetical protein